MYSLRSYARALAMDHGGLSRLLRGGGPIPSRRVRQLGARLCLPSNEVERLVACEDAGALLQAAGRADFRPDLRWIAAVTGVGVDRLQQALPTVLRSGELRMESRDRWVVRSKEAS